VSWNDWYSNLINIVGLTAYFGLFEVGRPVAGDTVVVSGASGATGSVVVQLAKICGCRVVGVAGTVEKCSWLTELGCDVALNYKDPEFKKKFNDATPKV
jgi:NADPH-dependent curcumin reductase CurA